MDRTFRTRLIEKLIQLARRMRELHDAGPVGPGFSLIELICIEADPTTASNEDACVEVVADGDAMAIYGWLEAAAELSGAQSVQLMLAQHGIEPELVNAIDAGTYGEAPADTGEPKAARVYRVVLDAMQTMVRGQLGTMPAIIIRNCEAVVIDELARTAAQAVVSELGL